MDAITSLIKANIRLWEFLSPLFLLATRLWVAWVFFRSGQNKFQSWEATKFLFKEEYKVPLLNPDIAAVLGTATEICFPVLLAIGLGGRPAAIVLFVFNIIAVYSYPALWSNAAGLLQHQLWGLMLAVIVFYGPGKLSIDHLIRSRYMAR